MEPPSPLPNPRHYYLWDMSKDELHSHNPYAINHLIRAFKMQHLKLPWQNADMQCLLDGTLFPSYLH